jgi:hypothetical protein
MCPYIFLKIFEVLALCLPRASISVSGPAHGGIEGNMSQEKPMLKVEEDMNIER